MEGDALYSVKWYRNEQEFYRFVPNDRPKLQIFPQKGIKVEVNIYFTAYALVVSIVMNTVNEVYFFGFLSIYCLYFKTCRREAVHAVIAYIHRQSNIFASFHVK